MIQYELFTCAQKVIWPAYSSARHRNK